MTWAALHADYRRNTQAQPGATHLSQFLRTVMTARFCSVLFFRLSQILGRRVPLVASLVKQLNQAVTGADLAWQSSVGPGLILYHPNGVVFGPGIVVQENCSIQQGVTIGGDGSITGGEAHSPRVGRDVTIGAGAKIFGAITIGDRARIGANAVVLQSVPADTTAVGVPARIISRSVSEGPKPE